MKTAQEFLEVSGITPTGQLDIGNNRIYTHWTESDIIRLLNAYGGYANEEGFKEGYEEAKLFGMLKPIGNISSR